MIRILRWQYWLPRLLLVTVVLLAAQYVLGRATGTTIIRWAEATFRAPVELTHARVSLVGRRVLLGNVRIADPGRERTNLLEADYCELRFAVRPLLQKQAIIEHGTISGLRFGTPRDDSDSSVDPPPHAAAAKSIAWANDDAARPARAWFAELRRRYESDLTGQLDSAQRTTALCEHWAEESAALVDRVRQLTQRSDELQHELDEAVANPLRHTDSLKSTTDEFVALEEECDALAKEVEAMTNLVDAERRAIVAARRDDESWLCQRLQFSPIDDDSLSAYLLREPVAKPLGELFDWLRFVRQIVPAQDASPAVCWQRGEEFLFDGCPRSPQVLIRQLAIRGTTRLGGQPVQLRGVLTDLASTPASHDRPMQLRMTTAGSLPLTLQATIDRTGPVAHDELLAQSDGILLPKVSLGDSDKLRLTVAPSVAAISIGAVLDGVQLIGHVRLVQKQVEITPNFGGDLGDGPLTSALADTLGDVEALSTELTLGGTLEEPKCTLSSNLAPAVAKALDSALNKAAHQQARRLFAESQRRGDRQLAELERTLSDVQAELRPQLAQAAGRLEKIAAQQRAPKRISTKYLGRRLPANSLFR